MSEAQNEKSKSLDIDSILENYARATNDTEIGEQSMESIVKWIENYEFTIQEESEMTKQYSTFTSELEKRISKLDCVDSNGRTIMPYMGSENGVGAWQYAASISNSNEGLTYVSDIEIGKTLNDLPDVVYKKLQSVLGEDTDTIDNANKVDKARNITNTIFGNEGSDGTVYTKDVVSVNDYVSAIVMDNNISATQTDLFVCILEPKANSVFTRTELPLILKKIEANQLNLKTINGLDVDYIKFLYNCGKPEDMKNLLDELVASTKKTMSEKGYEFKVTYGDLPDAKGNIRSQAVEVEFKKNGKVEGGWKHGRLDEAQNKRSSLDGNSDGSDSDGKTDADSSDSDGKTDADGSDGDGKTDVDSLVDDGKTNTDNSDGNGKTNTDSTDRDGKLNTDNFDSNGKTNTDGSDSAGKTNTDSSNSDEKLNTDNSNSDKKTNIDGSDSDGKTNADTDVAHNQDVSSGTSNTGNSDHVADTGTSDHVSNHYDSGDGSNTKTDGNHKNNTSDGSVKDIVDSDAPDRPVKDIIDADSVDSERVEFSEKSKNVISEYEKCSGEKIDTGKCPSKFIKKFNRVMEKIDKYSDILDIADVVLTVAQVKKLYEQGDIDGAASELRRYGITNLLSMGSATLATTLIGGLNPVVGMMFVVCAGICGSAAGEMISSMVDEVYDWFFRAGAYIFPADPLVLDLDGDGIETVSVKDGVYFDFDGNNFAEKTGWIGKDDGLLVRDINKNGNIDNGQELFGDDVYQNGFEALNSFDTNGDNKLDNQDQIFSELRVWKDVNQNGKVDEGELFHLEDLGIVGFDLNYENINKRDINGNSHTQTGAYIKADGSLGAMEDVWFKKDSADTKVVQSIPYDEALEENKEIWSLPDIRGYGNQYSLHQAMLRDETGKLKNLLEQYIAEKDANKRKAMITNIIYVWTGVENESSTARGGNISDSRKLEALEVISGRDFESAYGANPVYQAGQYIEQSFNQLVEMYYIELERQTTFSEMYFLLLQNADFDSQGNPCFDMAQVSEKLMEQYKMNPSEGRNFAIRFFVNVKNVGLFQWIDAEALTNQLPMLGSDILYQVNYSGNDVLYGTSGNDTLEGGMGNDVLRGDLGDDTYYFNYGDGNDTIRDYENSETSGKNDKIVFGEGIRPEDVYMERIGDDLYIRYSETDSVTIEDAYYYSDGRYQVESIVFADGTVWKDEEIGKRCNTRHGSSGNDSMIGYDKMLEYDPNETFYAGAGNDTIHAYGGDDTVYGEAGNDTIYAGAGDDRITGGTGNDYMNGDIGNDSYYLNLGDGADTIRDYENSETSGRDDKIVFGEGIRPEDVYMERIGDDLYIRYSETDSVTIENAYYYSDGRYQVENMEFIDNSKYSINYNDLNLNLVEAGDSTNEEEVFDTYTESIASDIINASADHVEDTSFISDSPDNVDALVESMTNLTVQEMSAIPSDNVVDVIDTCATVNEDNDSQLWIEK